MYQLRYAWGVTFQAVQLAEPDDYYPLKYEVYCRSHGSYSFDFTPEEDLAVIYPGSMWDQFGEYDPEGAIFYPILSGSTTQIRNEADLEYAIERMIEMFERDWVIHTFEVTVNAVPREP
jgi:hypothetical protein